MILRLAPHAAWQRALLAIIIGALSAFAFAPYDLWPLLVPAFALLLWLIDETRTWHGALLFGWALSFGQLAVGLDWIAVAFHYQAQMPPVLGQLAVLLLAAGLALFGGFASTAAWFCWSTSSRRVLVLGLCWTGGEWLRGHVLTGFPWNLVGSVWANWLPLAQGAAFFGVYGLSLLTVIWAAAAGLLVDRRQQRTILLLAASLGVAYGLGRWRLAHFPLRENARVQLHIVQANIGQDEKWQAGGAGPILNRYLQLSEEAVAAHGPGIIIWPETAVPPFAGRVVDGRAAIISFTDDAVLRSYVATKLLARGGYLLTGVDQFERDGNGTIIRAYNSLIAVDALGQRINRYDKVHLVPFGEYLPARTVLQWLGLDKFAAGAVDFSPGAVQNAVQLPQIPSFAALICYEAIFAGAAVPKNGPRPAWILNISNDAWFGTSSGPSQHLAQARLRAIEEGLPLVRGTPTGISSIFDPVGRMIAYLPQGRAQVLSHHLPLPIPPPIFSQYHDLAFAMLLLAVFIFSLLDRLKPERRR